MIEKNTENAIYLISSNNNLIMCNMLIFNDEHGIILGQACNNNLITDNNVSNNNIGGIYIYAPGDHNVIVNNTLISNRRTGISLYKCNNNTISNNSATYNGVGLVLAVSQNNRIKGNNLSNNEDFGFFLSSSNKNEITKNFVSFNDAGITMDFTSGNNILSLNNASFNTVGIISYSPNTIVNNLANSNSFCGILLFDGCENALIRGNNASNNANGILLDSGANYNRIINNTANTNEYNGIEVESNNNTLDSNTANSNKDGFLIDGENTILSDNCAKLNGKSGFFISGDNNILYNNIAESNPTGLLISSSNNIAYDNMIILNDYGIFLSSAIHNQIINNTLKDNKYGLYLSKSNNNTLKNNIILNNHYSIELIDAKNNMICNNKVVNSYCGIDLYLSDNNTISDNHISATWGIILDPQRTNIINNNSDITTNKTLRVIFGKILAMGITIANTTVTSGDVTVNARATIEKGNVDITTPNSETAEHLYTKATTTKEIIIDIGKNSTFGLAVENLMVSGCSVSADIIEIVLNNAPIMFVNPAIGVFNIDFDTKLNGTFTPEGDFTLTSEVPETVNISKTSGIIVDETQVIVVHATLSNTSDVIRVPVHITVNRTWFEEIAKGKLSNVKIFKINDTTGELVAVKEVVLVNQTDDTITFGAEFSNFSVFALIAQPAVTAAGLTSRGRGGSYAPPDTLTIPLANPGINIFHVEWLGLDITEVSIDLKRMAINAKMTLKKIEKPAESSYPEGIVYHYFLITTNIPQDNIASGTISFRVDKSWISSNTIDVSTVTLNRYTGKWETLPTTKIREDSNYTYYSAKTAGFSTFVITGKQKDGVFTAAEPTPAPTVKATTYPTTIPVARQPEKKVNSILISGVIVVAILLSGSIYYFIRRNRNL